LLQLAHGSEKHSLDILEDVPIKVGNFCVLDHFIIVDIARESYIEIIVGRPFLATCSCKIDVKRGWLAFHVGKFHVEFNSLKIELFPLLHSSLMKCPFLMRLRWMVFGVVLALLCLGFYYGS